MLIDSDLLKTYLRKKIREIESGIESNPEGDLYTRNSNKKIYEKSAGYWDILKFVEKKETKEQAEERTEDTYWRDG